MGLSTDIEKRRGKAGRGPSPLSSAKEIVGSHGHRSHGRSIRWPALYEHLLAKGMTKQKAAMISNGQWRKKHGLPPKSVPGTKGKVRLSKMIGPDGKCLNVKRPLTQRQLGKAKRKRRRNRKRL